MRQEISERTLSLCLAGLGLFLFGCRANLPEQQNALRSFSEAEPQPLASTHANPVTPASFAAEVSLDIRGCTSCSDCRLTMRQIAQAVTDAEEVSLSHDGRKMHLRYQHPSQLPLKELAQALAENGPRPYRVIRATLSAPGYLLHEREQSFFVPLGTDQRIPVSSGAFPETPQPVLVTADLPNLADAESPHLELRSVKPYSNP